MVDKGKGIAYDLNVEPVDDEDEGVSDCSICFEQLGNDDRTIVKLSCDHEFHLDCIGSAFNAKNKMQCPYCRNVEQGQWLYASGPPNPGFFVADGPIAEEYDEQGEVDLGSSPNMVTSAQPLMAIGDLPAPAPFGDDPLFPSAQRQLGGMVRDSWLTSYGTNQALYHGYVMGRAHALEMVRLQNVMEANIARIVASESISQSILQRLSTYGDGESSRSGGRIRRARGGSSHGGRGNGNGGGNSNGGGSG